MRRLCSLGFEPVVPMVEGVSEVLRAAQAQAMTNHA
jgi:hypothetical protein